MNFEIARASSLEYLVLSPEDRDEVSYPLLIWLHGFGADMNDLAPLAAAVHPTGYLHVLPNAPLGGFAAPEGTVRGWYERGGGERRESVQQALAGLDAFVQEVMARFRIPPGRALLLGFSQGGSLALRYGLPRPDVFAGLAVLSGSLRQVDGLLKDLPTQRNQAIFMAHGGDDSMVPAEWARRVDEFLRDQGYHPHYGEFPMGHEISPDLFAELSEWITRTLPPAIRME